MVKGFRIDLLMVECFGVSVNVRNVNYGDSDKIIATIRRLNIVLVFQCVDKLFKCVDNLFNWIDMYVINNTVFV